MFWKNRAIKKLKKRKGEVGIELARAKGEWGIWQQILDEKAYTSLSGTPFTLKGKIAALEAELDIINLRLSELGEYETTTNNNM